MSRRAAAHRLIEVSAELASIQREIPKGDNAHVTLSMLIDRVDRLKSNLQKEDELK